MDSRRYKKQFIEFIKTIYPDGVPDDISCVELSNPLNDRQYKFYFDFDDCNGSSNEKFSDADREFLKGLKVTLDDKTTA